MFCDFKNDIFIEAKVHEPSYGMPEFHYHNHYEIYYLLSGKRRYVIDYKMYDINAGDLVLINKRTLHLTKPLDKSRHERIVLNISENFMQELGENNIKFKDIFNTNYIKADEKYKRIFYRILQNILKENEEKDEFSNILIHNYVFELLTTIYRAVNDENKGSCIPTVYNERIDTAIKYIYDHFREKITLNNLADLCHTNSSYLSRQFKEITGMTFIYYLNSLRIREASKLLINSDLSIIEIANNCGFDSMQHFCDIFKKTKGMSAREFRNFQKTN